MKLYAFIIFEVLFLMAFAGYWIPWCINQSSDFWFIVGIVSIFSLPVEIYRFIYKVAEMNKEF
jgi:hypothetical protein